MSFSFDALPPVQTGAVARFREIAKVPATFDGAPAARVQQIEPVPGLGEAMAVLDTRGVVWLYQPGGSGDEDGDGFRDAPLIDIRESDLGFTAPGPESGLRSIAFHPDFSEPGAPGEGKLYLAYSATPGSASGETRLFAYDREVREAGPVFHDVVTEFTVPDASDPSATSDSARELLRIEQPFGNHNFGMLRFDGAALLLSVGDGGSAADPLDAGQRLNEALGKILRIDPLAGTDGATYGVPEDNPFFGTAGALPEIYAYGFRNPQQISLDEGRLFASDIGQDTIEEINLILPGENYGWRLREGTFATVGRSVTDLPESDAPLVLQYPVTQYDHEETRLSNAAVGGGFVYRGDDLPALNGAYVFTDFPGGDVFFTRLGRLGNALDDGVIAADETRAPLRLEFWDEEGRPIGFGDVAANPVAGGRVDLRLAQTADGDLLAFSKTNGAIYAFEAVPAEERPIVGSRRDDLLVGSRDTDLIFGRAGDDVLRGLQAGDVLKGRSGDDTLRGGQGDDDLEGGRGRDRLFGGEGNDLLVGGRGRDVLLGGEDSDAEREVAPGIRTSGDVAVVTGSPDEFDFFGAVDDFRVEGGPFGSADRMIDIEHILFNSADGDVTTLVATSDLDFL